MQDRINELKKELDLLKDINNQHELTFAISIIESIIANKTTRDWIDAMNVLAGLSNNEITFKDDNNYLDVAEEVIEKIIKLTSNVLIKIEKYKTFKHKKGLH